MNALKTIATLLAFILTMPLAAGSIDVAQAKMRVEKFRSEQTRRKNPSGKRNVQRQDLNLQHVYTQQTAGGQPAVYVFNSSDGFVLASADDAVPSVLGYSDNSDFDPNNIPDGLKYLMGEYASR